MKVTLSPREQRVILLVLGLGGVILWVYGVYILGPLMRDAADVRRQTHTARQQLKALEFTTANEPMLQEQSRQLDQSVVALRRLLPGEEELSTVIERLSGFASEAKVKIVTISPRPVDARSTEAKPADPASAYYKTIPIHIDAEAGYHELGSFLSLVESDSKPLRVFSLKISSDANEPKQHRIKLVIRAYFATGKGTASVSG
jgi:Tfp pilus assembly protein PilO